MAKLKQKLILKTERLKLVACNESIMQELIDEALTGLVIADGWVMEDTKDALPTFLAMQKMGESLLGWGLWLIVLGGTNIVIGSCGFIGNPDKKGGVEIGYSIAPEYRRKGYTFEACKKLVDWAFFDDNVKTIKATCDKNNFISVKVLEKLEMKFVKINKKGILEYSISKRREGK